MVPSLLVTFNFNLNIELSYQEYSLWCNFHNLDFQLELYLDEKLLSHGLNICLVDLYGYYNLNVAHLVHCCVNV